MKDVFFTWKMYKIVIYNEALSICKYDFKSNMFSTQNYWMLAISMKDL